jgi:hypothetical protein
VRSETSETLEYLSLRERSDRQVRVRGYRLLRKGRTPSPAALTRVDLSPWER